MLKSGEQLGTTIERLKAECEWRRARLHKELPRDYSGALNLDIGHILRARN
jgi:hypothetical protein